MTRNAKSPAIRKRHGQPGRTVPVLATAAIMALVAGPAHAYLGPGLGLGIIGTVIGVIAAIVLTLFGLVWYPLKRMFARKPAATDDPAQRENVDPGDTAENHPAE